MPTTSGVQNITTVRDIAFSEEGLGGAGGVAGSACPEGRVSCTRYQTAIP